MGISNWEIVYLNMLSKIHWKNGEVGLSYMIHKCSKIELKWISEAGLSSIYT